MRRGLLSQALTAMCVVGLVAAAGAAKKTTDAVWTRPDYANLHIDRIALIPVTSYDNNIQNENLVEATLSPSLRGSGYRWLSGTSTREMLRARTGGDSLLKVLRGGILARARLDSTNAPSIAAMLNCDAMLTVRIDQFERHEPEWDVAGKPFTTIQLHAALVDSRGRLLWSVSGTETSEGPYYDPSTNPTSVNDTGLERKPVSSQGGAPSFHEVLALITARWADEFPRHADAAKAPADSAATHH